MQAPVDTVGLLGRESTSPLMSWSLLSSERVPLGCGCHTHVLFRDRTAGGLELVFITFPRWPGPDQIIFLEKRPC